MRYFNSLFNVYNFHDLCSSLCVNTDVYTNSNLMKFSITRSLLPILVILAIDLYVFQAVKVVSTTQPMARKAIFIAFWAMTALAITLLLCATFANWHDFPRFIKTYVFGFIVIFYFSKVVVLPFLLIDDLVDTGKTMKLVREILPKAHVATVYAKPLGRPLVDTFITEVSQDTWIYFPWDLELSYAKPIAAK